MKYLILALLLSGCSSEVTKPSIKSIYLNDVSCGILVDLPVDSNKKTILVIGDSISMGYGSPDSVGYHPMLQTLLPQYNVIHNPCNAGYSGHALLNMDSYLAIADQFEAIIFNVGIWDIDSNQVTPWEYSGNLTEITKKIKAKTKNAVFLTTTYYPYNAAKQEQMRKYANEIMLSLDVNVYDLGALSRNNLNLLNHPDLIHYTNEGYTIFASNIVNFLQTKVGL